MNKMIIVILFLVIGFVGGYFVGLNSADIQNINDITIVVDDTNTRELPDLYWSEIGSYEFGEGILLLKTQAIDIFVPSYENAGQ